MKFLHLQQGLNCGPAVIDNSPINGQTIEPDVLWKLSRHPNFIGVKEYGGNETID